MSYASRISCQISDSKPILLVASTMTSSGLRVLTTDTDAPVVTKTTVKTHLLHSLNVFTKALVKEICILVACLSILDITVTIQHVSWDLELEWISDHCDNFIDLIGSQLASTLIHVDVALLANDVGKPTANSLDGCEGEHYLLSTIHVGVAYTQDMLEILRCHRH